MWWPQRWPRSERIVHQCSVVPKSTARRVSVLAAIPGGVTSSKTTKHPPSLSFRFVEWSPSFRTVASLGYPVTRNPPATKGLLCVNLRKRYMKLSVYNVNIVFTKALPWGFYQYQASLELPGVTNYVPLCTLSLKSPHRLID